MRPFEKLALLAGFAAGGPGCTTILGIAEGIDYADAGTVDASGAADGSPTDAPFQDSAASADGIIDSAPQDAGLVGCNGCVVLASGQGLPNGIAVDTQNVYWANLLDDAGGVWSCAIAGCNLAPTEVAFAQEGWGVAVSQGVLYATGTLTGLGWIGAVPLDGGSGNDGTYGPDTTTSIATDGFNVYFILNFNAGSSLQSCPSQDVTNCGAIFSNAPFGLNSVAAAGNATQYVTLQNGGLYAVTAGAAALVVDAAASPVPYGIAVDSTHVYWTDLTLRQVSQYCLPDGCDAGVVVLAQGQAPRNVAVDTSNVYWTDPVANTVSKCAIGGCGAAPTIVAQEQSEPWGIAVDSTYVYWTNQGNGTVVRAPK